MSPIGRLAVVLCALGAAASAEAQPRPLEPVRIERLPVPEGYTAVVEPAWLPDGEHLVASFTSAEEPAPQLAVMDRHGREARCLTCGLPQVQGADRPFNTGQPLATKKPFPFPDGRRVLVMLVTQPDEVGGVDLPGPNRGAPDFNYAILECAPSVIDCRERELVPLELQGGGLSRAVQNREGRLSPDGVWFAWTQVALDGTRMTLGRLERGASAYTVAQPRVLTPPRPPADDTNAATWNAAAALYELKRFTPDGNHVLYASFQTAENFDAFSLDLRTGATRRLTSEPEWDEDVSRSPDGKRIAVYASRGLDRMTPMSQFERPTFIDFPVFASVGRYMLKQQSAAVEGFGSCLLAPWLMSRDGEEGGYFGQPLVVGENGFWPAPVGQWRPQGNAVLLWEHRTADAPAGGADARAVIAWLDRVRARGPKPPPATPEPTWAPLWEEWQGYHDEQRSAVIPGPGAGTAVVMLAGGVNFHEYSVSYDGYSADGKTFIDGTERMDSPFTVAANHWRADLHARGDHTGHLVGDLTLSAGQGSGSLDSEWDGRRYSGLPSATACKPVALPRIAPRILRTRRSRGRTYVEVSVRADVPHDGTPRPVKGAQVQLGSARARSNFRGRARLRASRRALRRGGTVRVRAHGFQPGSARLLPSRLLAHSVGP